MMSQSVLPSPDPELWRLLAVEDDSGGDSARSRDAAAPSGWPTPLDVWLL